MNLNEMSANELVNKIYESDIVDDNFKYKLNNIIDVFNALDKRDKYDEFDSRLTSVAEEFGNIVGGLRYIQANLLLTNPINPCDFATIENINDYEFEFTCECSIRPSEYNEDIVKIMRIVLGVPSKDSCNKLVTWKIGNILNEDGVKELLSKLVKADNMIECFLHA